MLTVKRTLLVLALLVGLHAGLAAATREFSVPLAFLKAAADAVVIDMDVTVSGHSAIHKLASDCEMHFGAHSAAFDGDPDGLVLEPMNICEEDAPPALGSWVK